MAGRIRGAVSRFRPIVGWAGWDVWMLWMVWLFGLVTHLQLLINEDSTLWFVSGQVNGAVVIPPHQL
ncbi:MAG: hypothetical protein A3I66_11605 [Burkholderiales bacterium RIFCSPLOWO2_02_FULL_57_36]|nr:MAG: hypothetical protein A3I66_11605 [Burkholderiales bacterium RIFCSPLOWO2_02_FULL_57_36]